MDKVKNLPYIDIQHDALAVFDDVEQGTVVKENVWVSAYCSGAESVHGKVTVEIQDGEVGFESSGGVTVERESNTNFAVSVPALKIEALPVRFPRQIIQPPYTKKTDVSPELHINSIAYSAKSAKLVIGGPDGYCVVLPPAEPAKVVELKGHVGDVLAVSWFPSGEVVLTASSDLSLRVFGAKDGINPRVFKGHTRAITGIHILGVGRQVMSCSKDGSVRLWDVGRGEQVSKWSASAVAVEAMVVVEDEAGVHALGALGDEEKVVLAATAEGSITGWALSAQGGPPLFTAQSPVSSKLVTMAYSDAAGVLATGHADGTIALRRLSSLVGSSPAPTLIKRNEAAIYTLVFDWTSTDLLVGTSSGLPCRLGIDAAGETVGASTREEYAGWEAVAIESFAFGDGVWCAGGEGGVRRY